MTRDSVREMFGNQSGMAIISEIAVTESLVRNLPLATQSKHFSGSIVQIFYRGLK
jgi:hypothetical protein